jgi:hypothetical protein
MLLSVAALSLCCPVNEEVPQLRQRIDGTGNDEVRVWALERKLARHNILFQDTTSLKRK